MIINILIHLHFIPASFKSLPPPTLNEILDSPLEINYTTSNPFFYSGIVERDTRDSRLPHRTVMHIITSRASSFYTAGGFFAFVRTFISLTIPKPKEGSKELLVLEIHCSAQ